MRITTEKVADDSLGRAVTGEVVIVGGNQSLAVFTKTLKAIDETIHGDLGPQCPNISQPEVNEANDGKVMDMEFVESKAAVTDHQYADLRDIPCFQQCMEHGDSMQLGFNIGSKTGIEILDFSMQKHLLDTRKIRWRSC